MENVNPRVFEKTVNRPVLPKEENDFVNDEIDSREIFGKLESTALTVSYVCTVRLYYNCN